MNRLSMALVAVTVLVAACTGGEPSVAPASTTTAAVIASSTTAPSTTTPSTTAPSTTATHPSPSTTNRPEPSTTIPSSTSEPGASTTTAPAPTLFHEGSPMVRFSVTVGVGVEGLTRDDLARFVVDTLADDRGWIGRGVGFELLDEGGEFTLIVALPDEVDRMCAPLQTNGRFSCARNGWIALNSLRWFGATDDWPGDLETYRRYLVNHEVGHYILGPGHDACPGPGEPAPIMMQQTKGLDGCEPNGWVLPEG